MRTAIDMQQHENLTDDTTISGSMMMKHTCAASLHNSRRTIFTFESLKLIIKDVRKPPLKLKKQKMPKLHYIPKPADANQDVVLQV